MRSAKIRNERDFSPPGASRVTGKNVELPPLFAQIQSPRGREKGDRVELHQKHWLAVLVVIERSRLIPELLRNIAVKAVNK